ncbi:nephrocystin-1 [Nephila pilipes]|uniref:Nephrocystin-1 n=1 Tax=Nephila pilipes TaxID=299642 RepID=A0A8X6NA39_NEPPI|nr:nephrocystin-1 [Nephila pilipes]
MQQITIASQPFTRIRSFCRSLMEENTLKFGSDAQISNFHFISYLCGVLITINIRFLYIMSEVGSQDKDEEKQNYTFECEALHDFIAEEETDLSFKQNELLVITGLRNDGWWEARNEDGLTGLVPSTFFKIPDHVKSIIEGTFHSEKEKKNSSSIEFRSPSRKVKQILSPELSGSSRIAEEDEPPKSFMDQFSMLSLNQDILPKGFRPSILFELVKKNSYYNLGNFMAPKLDETGISFKDIQYEKTLLKPNATLLQKKINLIAARQIPEPPNDFIVKSRHIRMCFHDGNKVLSNIHTVKAKWSVSAPKLWMFSSKISAKDSCSEDGEIFIKCNKCVPTLGILFELCISYENSRGISGEMCSGWAFMKLLNDSGEPIKSKTNILKIQDTEPFAAYLFNTDSQGITGFFRKIKDKQKLSRIVISICDPDRASNQHISYLPSCLIGPWSCIPILSMCRKLTAEDLLERNSFDSIERILSPFLASMPRVLNEPDLVDALRLSWATVVKTMNADDIRMDSTKKKVFRDLFCETVFVIINSNNLPPYVFGNSHAENARKTEIDRLLRIQENQEETLPLSGELEFLPLSINMLSADVINLNKGAMFQ